MACEESLLLALPDPCLLLVLRCCAATYNHRSLFSAARSYSRLHQAAVVALRDVKLHRSQQQQVDGMMVYLGKHGQDANRMHLAGYQDPSASLCQLPQLQLSSLELLGLDLQLQPGAGFQGVLGGAAALAALKQLQLTAGC